MCIIRKCLFLDISVFYFRYCLSIMRYCVSITVANFLEDACTWARTVIWLAPPRATSDPGSPVPPACPPPANVPLVPSSDYQNGTASHASKLGPRCKKGRLEKTFEFSEFQLICCVLFLFYDLTYYKIDPTRRADPAREECKSLTVREHPPHAIF